jgi:hypothetical protein
LPAFFPLFFPLQTRSKAGANPVSTRVKHTFVRVGSVFPPDLKTFYWPENTRKRLPWASLNLKLMGRLVNGPNGPIVGKVGTIIGSSINGRYYIKGPHKPRTKDISEDEKRNQNKFGMAQLWLGPLKEFVRVGFKGYAPTFQGFQGALSYLLHNAFEGEQPNISINPALVKVSYGNLPLPADISVVKLPDNRLQFTWDATPIEGIHSADQVMMLAYQIVPISPKEPRWYSYNTTGQLRSAGTDTLPLYGPGTYHIWCAFVAHDRSRQSDSVYLGTVDV